MTPARHCRYDGFESLSRTWKRRDGPMLGRQCWLQRGRKFFGTAYRELGEPIALYCQKCRLSVLSISKRSRKTDCNLCRYFVDFASNSYRRDYKQHVRLFHRIKSSSLHPDHSALSQRFFIRVCSNKIDMFCLKNPLSFWFKVMLYDLPQSMANNHTGSVDARICLLNSGLYSI